jgi:multidrug efflux pump subunit AcrA (membrane-fusion protein)
MNMTSASLIATAILIGLAQTSDADRYSTQAPDPEIEALITVADVVKLSAKEAGVLVHLGVEEGATVRASQTMGKIYDSEAQIQKKAAEFGAASAWKKTQDDVEIRFQKASAAVYQAEHEQLQESNRLADRSVTQSDIRLAKLKWDQAVLGTEKTMFDQQLAHYDYQAKRAELAAANLAIERRVIKAPFDGVVEEIFRKQDEWVTAGDPILHLFRLDTMKVEGVVDSSQYDPHEVQGCEVTVVVQMARGRQETVRGRITRVSNIVLGNGEFEVGAEVANRQEHGAWLLRHGQLGKMTIHLGTGGQAATEVSRAE